MLINAYEVFCPSVPVCIKIVDGGARRRRRAVCAVPFTSTIQDCQIARIAKNKKLLFATEEDDSDTTIVYECINFLALLLF